MTGSYVAKLVGVDYLVPTPFLLTAGGRALAIQKCRESAGDIVSIRDQSGNWICGWVDGIFEVGSDSKEKRS